MRDRRRSFSLVVPKCTGRRLKCWCCNRNELLMAPPYTLLRKGRSLPTASRADDVNANAGACEGRGKVVGTVSAMGGDSGGTRSDLSVKSSDFSRK